jgi:hypothetical protein
LRGKTETGGTGMKYSELEGKVNEFYMTIKIEDTAMYIQDEGDDIALISIENQFVMDTDYDAFWFLHSTVQNKVLDWCYQISKTPLEERD